MHSNIRSIALTETFHEEDNVKLSEEELKEVHRIRDDLTLQRRDPAAYDAMMARRAQAEYAQMVAERHQHTNTLSAGQVRPTNATSRPPSNATSKSYEDGRVARQAGTNADSPNLNPNIGKILQDSGPKPVIGPAPVVVSQSQQALPIQPTSSSGQLAKPARAPLSNLQPVQKLGLQSNVQASPSTLGQNPKTTASTNNQSGGHPIYKDNAKASSRDSIKGAASTAKAKMSAEIAKIVGLVTPKRTGTPTSGQPGNPATPSKTNFRIPIPTTPGTPSKSTGTPSKTTSTGADASRRSATAPVTAVGSRANTSGTDASAPSGPVLKRKLSNTSSGDKYPGSRSTTGQFISTYKSLGDAFVSGTQPERKRAKS